MRFDTILPGAGIGEKILELLRANEYRENVHIVSTVFVDGFGPPSTTGPIGLSIVAARRHDIPRARHRVHGPISAPGSASPTPRCRCG